MPPRITHEPAGALVDEPPRILVEGLPPGERVTLRAVARDVAGRRWISEATFVAGDAGRVDVAALPPLAGSYTGADATGLLWSLAPSFSEGERAPFASAAIEPLRVELTAEVSGAVQARAELLRRFVAPDVTCIAVRERGLVATLFVPPGEGPFPGAILLGGSSGGLREPMAALLASHGVAALALAYFGLEGLPPRLASIPLEYFETALSWLAARPEVRGTRVAALGPSRGGEAALLLGATFPRLVRAVVAYAPSGVIWGAVGGDEPAWTYQGRPLERMPNRVTPEQEAEILAREPYALRRWYALNLEDATAREAAAIPVERIAGPVLLLSGEDDQLWPSTEMANLVMARLDAARFPYPHTHLSYPGAGHLIGIPGLPTTVQQRYHIGAGVALRYGGSPQTQAHANASSWRHVLALLRDGRATMRL